MTDPTPQGTPCWYELSTSDLQTAGEFYAAVLDWTIADSGMDGVTYHLATAPDGGNVAGLSPLPDTGGAPPPSWLIYFTCDDCDQASAAIASAGGHIVVEPADIPGTGRFAICADPQGAVFGLLQPAPMDAPPAQPAFDQQAAGHGNWHELMSSDPEAGFAFYAEQFGWAKGETMDMGEMGSYQLFQVGGTDVGGIMGLGTAPMAVWLPYFGSQGVEATIERIRSGGGAVHHGPTEVPGGTFTAIATDPQGAWFAVVGPR